MRIRNAILSFLGLTSLTLAALVYQAYRRDIEHAVQRVSSGSRVASTACGPIEYASAGDGFPVLVIHGAGGGFDQGLGLAEYLSGYRVVLVSRFGYLRTPLPAEASAEAQADAHACLLDALGIRQAAVLAISAGAPSGLQFCLRHPDRCSALALLVPAAFLPDEGSKAKSAPRLTQLLAGTVLRSDFAYWLTAKLALGVLTENILATPPEIVEQASSSERQRARTVLMNILPVSRRGAGLLNDAAVLSKASHGDPGKIHVPTLLISVEDDLYGTVRVVRALARQIPGSRLVVYPSGGHSWIGHDEEVRAEVEAFLKPFSASTLLRFPR